MCVCCMYTHIIANRDIVDKAAGQKRYITAFMATGATELYCVTENATQYVTLLVAWLDCTD